MFHWVVHLKGGPEGRYPAAVAVGHKVYSFGGLCTRQTYEGQFQVDVHVFNTDSLHWTKLPPATTSGRTEEVPSMRYGHTAVLIGDVIYVWGGDKYIYNLCNVLYAFNANTHRWFETSVKGNVPQARYKHSACGLGEVMYIFGGYLWESGYNNDIYTLDTATMLWSLISTRGVPAPPSAFHSAIIIDTSMFIFGGEGAQDEDHYNRIRVFDTETSSWLSAPSALIPEGRNGHSAFAYNEEMYIFAGCHRKFNPHTFTWRKVELKGGGPSSILWRERLCACVVGHRTVFLGGYTPGDVYILDVCPSLKTLCKLSVTQHGLDQSGLPHDIRWELAAMNPNRHRRNTGRTF